jgi:hypothetical protein
MAKDVDALTASNAIGEIGVARPAFAAIKANVAQRSEAVAHPQ